jgi:hypothetical protein
MPVAPRALVWAGALAFSATLFWVYPITSDLFDYLGTAYVLTDLGANPLLVPRTAFPDSAFLRAYGTPYTHLPSAYGPLWNLLAAPGTLGRTVPALGVAWLKGVATGSFLACAWLVERIASRLSLRPTAAKSDGARQATQVLGRNAARAGTWALYLFAWNPLVLVAGVADGHNDLAMMALVMASFWCLLNRRPVAATALLTLSVGVKYVSILLLPIWGLYLWRTVPTRQRRQVLALTAAVSAGVVAGMLAPFWEPDLMPALLKRLLTPDTWTVATEGARRWLMAAGIVLLVGGYGWELRSLFQRLARPPAQMGPLVESSFTVLLLVFLLGAARSQPWHLLWALTLAPLAAVFSRWNSRLAAAVSLIWLSGAMLAAMVWVEWGHPGPWVWPAVGAALLLAAGLMAQQYAGRRYANP